MRSSSRVGGPLSSREGTSCRSGEASRAGSSGLFQRNMGRAPRLTTRAVLRCYGARRASPEDARGVPLGLQGAPGRLRGSPGRLGCTPGRLGCTPGRLGCTPSRLGDQRRRLGDPAGRLGDPAGRLGDPAVYRAIHAVYRAIHAVYRAIHAVYRAIHAVYRAIHAVYRAIHAVYRAIHAVYRAIHAVYRAIHAVYRAIHAVYRAIHAVYRAIHAASWSNEAASRRGWLTEAPHADAVALSMRGVAPYPTRGCPPLDPDQGRAPGPRIASSALRAANAPTGAQPRSGALVSIPLCRAPPRPRPPTPWPASPTKSPSPASAATLPSSLPSRRSSASRPRPPSAWPTPPSASSTRSKSVPTSSSPEASEARGTRFEVQLRRDPRKARHERIPACSPATRLSLDLLIRGPCPRVVAASSGARGAGPERRARRRGRPQKPMSLAR